MIVVALDVTTMYLQDKMKGQALGLEVPMWC